MAHDIEKSINKMNDRFGFKMYELVTSSVFDIPQRLRAYDKSLFIVRSLAKDTFEVHSTDNKGGSTYCFTVPYPQLDGRVIDIAMRGDMKGNGLRFMQDVLKEEERMIEQQEKERRNFTRDFAEEFRPLFKKAKDEMGL